MPKFSTPNPRQSVDLPSNSITAITSSCREAWDNLSHSFQRDICPSQRLTSQVSTNPARTKPVMESGTIARAAQLRTGQTTVGTLWCVTAGVWFTAATVQFVIGNLPIGIMNLAAGTICLLGAARSTKLR